jgi:DNA primase
VPTGTSDASPRDVPEIFLGLPAGWPVPSTEVFFLANHIPEDKIAEIRHAVDIAEIISETVLLRKAGKNLVGLCPFHSEKTPSFTVSPDKQIFHCFGCSAGGNVFSFVMKRDGLQFGEAARMLARRCGVDIPERPLSGPERRLLSEQETLFEINRLAADFFHQQLVQPGGAGGEAASAYLERRGLSRQTIVDFRLGYAPKGWDHLIGFLARRRHSPALIEKAGLVVARKDASGHYDRFRDRVMFPIYDDMARVVGFGGRVMDDSTPKYLNSPETPVYLKRRVLYGLHRAKDACRALGTVYIVEGYLDLIALHQHGISNAVATLGTALSPEHIRLLTRHASQLVLVYDSDEAGIRSAQRCVDIFWKEHVDFRRGDVFRDETADTRILVLPTGHDPDSFVFQHGADSFRALTQNAPGIVGFLIERAVARHGLTTEGKIRIVTELQAPLAAINDSVARALYVKQVAETIGVAEHVIQRKLREADTRGSRESAQPPPKPVAEGEERFEQRIVSMMLQFPEILPDVIGRNVLDWFASARMKAAGEAIVRHGLRSTSELPELLAGIEDADLKDTLTELAMGDESWTLKGCRALLTRFLETRQKHSAGRSLQLAIETAERERNEGELMRLLEEKQRLAVRRERQKMSTLRDKS